MSHCACCEVLLSFSGEADHVQNAALLVIILDEAVSFRIQGAIVKVAFISYFDAKLGEKVGVFN
jgi:hypothetical protein